MDIAVQRCSDEVKQRQVQKKKRILSNRRQTTWPYPCKIGYKRRKSSIS